MKKLQKGFTLIEVVAVIGIVAVLAGMMIPLANRTLEADKMTKVRAELQDIAEALDFYFYDRAAYPSTIDDSAFLRHYLQPGIDDEFISDDFSKSHGATYGYYVNTSANPDEVNVWSVGPDMNDDSSGSGSVMGGDDIYVTSYSAIPGRQKTRMRLDLIGAALCKYYWDPAYSTPNTMTAVANWSSTTTMRDALLLTAELGSDGFGNGFVNTAPPASGSAYNDATIYSKGYDGADDTGGDDDITF